MVLIGTQYKLNVLNIFHEIKERLQNTRQQKHVILKRGDESYSVLLPFSCSGGVKESY